MSEVDFTYHIDKASFDKHEPHLLLLYTLLYEELRKQDQTNKYHLKNDSWRSNTKRGQLDILKNGNSIAFIFHHPHKEWLLFGPVTKYSVVTKISNLSQMSASCQQKARDIEKFFEEVLGPLNTFNILDSDGPL